MHKFGINYKFTFNPIVRYMALNLGECSGVNIVKREVPIVISLTSKEENFRDLELSMFSILNQDVKADRIILWLSNEYELAELPYSVTRYIKNGLEIRFVEDIGVYNKIIYALKEFNNSIVVCASDDIIYPKDWLKKLYHSYISHPENIHTHRALGIKQNYSSILSVKDWDKYVKKESAEFSNFSVNDGGILFPPGCFSKEVFREDVFTKNAPISADIWLWFMSLVSDRRTRVVKNHIKVFTCTNIIRKFLYICSKKNTQIFDDQIQNLMSFYKQNIMQRLN